MEDWLHCNACFIRIIHGPVSFSVTNCAHIFCNKCIERVANSTCTVCNKKCSAYTLLHNKMDPTTANYFKDPGELAQKAMNMFKLSEDVRKFQATQRKSLLKAIVNKAEQKEKLLQTAVATMSETKRKNSELKFIIKNKNNLSSVSPKSHSYMPMQYSPDCSPPSSPNRNISTRKTPPHYYSSVPCTPNKTSADGHQHRTHLSGGYTVSPNNEKPRMSLRSPPVGGKIQTPPDLRLHHSSPDGIVSKQASLHSMKQSTYFSKFQTPKSPMHGTTPHSTHSTPQSRCGTPRVKAITNYGVSLIEKRRLVGHQ
ncbi:uncharacterized protein LOC100182936 isoform X1 [Ciona intestinalis]